jgi:hypothetical protein
LNSFFAKIIKTYILKYYSFAPKTIIIIIIIKMSWENDIITSKTDREERERQYQIEREEEIEEYHAWREQQKPERNPALWIILAKQESARLQERERLRDEEKERECMDEEDNDVCDCVTSTRSTCEYTGPEEHDLRFDYDSLVDDSDWLQAHANKLWATTSPPVLSNGENSRSYDWDPKPPNEEYEWDPKPPIEEYDWIQAIENRKNSNPSCYDWEDPNPEFKEWIPWLKEDSPLPGTVEELYKSFDLYDDDDEYNWYQEDEEEEEEMPLRKMNDVQIERYVELTGRCPRDECDEWTMVYNGGDIFRYSYCKFIQWHIEDQTVSNITITRATFDEITFTNYVFDNVTFEECVFKDIILNNTTFKNSKFIECQLDSSIVPDKSCEIINYFDSDDDN